MQTYIIAEAGVNHNGSLEIAMKLVDAAKDAGVDAIKFQTFKTENLVTRSAKQAEYQIENFGDTDSQFEMLKQLELSFESFVKLNDYCNELGIEFLSTPFDFESVDFLCDRIGISKVKVSSGDLTNTPFLHYIATKGKPIIISTGMATLDEIHEALAFIAYGYLRSDDKVTIDEVQRLYKTKEAKDILSKLVTVLHCTTQYPAPAESINLKAMHEIKSIFQLETGLSDHSKGIHIPLAAVALGAKVIEKHFTLDKTLVGPDHRASIDPVELQYLVQHIREVESALGDGIKTPRVEEMQNVSVVRKSLVAKKRIELGEVFSEENLTIKRPGSGKAPSMYWNYIGQVAKKSYEEDQLIDE